jgi:aerobic C4-dicarboxylate transport protein
MSMGRATVNMIGNGVASVVLARWEGELDRVTLRRNLGQSFEAATLPLSDLEPKTAQGSEVVTE